MFPALLVDDEPPALRELKRLLAAHPQIPVAGEAQSVGEGLEAVGRLRPAVVFADIEMPDGTGFDLLARMSDPAPRLIFVTAHNDYAVRAFEANALDYLLKPVRPDRLTETARRIIAGTRPAAPRQVGAEDPVLIRHEREYALVAPAEIVQILARGDYTVVETRDRRSLTTHRPLAEWEESLPPGLFLRVHRSTLVNRRFVVHVSRGADAVWRLHLGNGISGTVECSRRHATDVLRELGQDPRA